jgi:hydroxymethylglutaryl-CoA synthase
MVKKAVRHLGETFGWDDARTAAWFESRVEPCMAWNRRCGNSYTASLWLSVAHALAGAAPGTRLLAFSYGSGFGSELLALTAGPGAASGAFAADVQVDLASRKMLDGAGYEALRGGVVPAH